MAFASSWAVIGTPVDFANGEPPFEIAPGYLLRPATAEEAAVIGDWLTVTFGRQGDGFRMAMELPADVKVTRAPLPPPPVGVYSIIQHDNNNVDADLRPALTASSSDLHILFEFLKPAGAYFSASEVASWIQGTMFSPTRPTPRLFTFDDALDVRANYARVQAVRTSGAFPDIARTLQDLHLIKTLPSASPFRLLGMFAIVEALIIHDPVGDDDSLTRQLKTKLALLNRRFAQAIVVSDYFPGCDSLETVVTRLYRYRSSIAHGNAVDFGDGPLKIIGTSESAQEFMYEMVRRVLRQALIEPQLVTDLKRC